VEKRKRGRPRIVQLITLDQALEVIKEHLWLKYRDEIIVNRMKISRKTLYNKIHRGLLDRHGSHKCALVDKFQVIEKLVG